MPTTDEDGLVDSTSIEEKKLKRLRERKLEIEVTVQAIEQNLKRNGYMFDDHKHISPVPQPGIRINNKLSFRGKQKCSELYRRLDEDDDGTLCFDDFRAMRSLSSPYGLVEDSDLSHWESWQMAMADSGIKLTDTFVDESEFIRYRALVEPKISLAHDLEKSGLGFLPETQMQWSTVKRRIQECLKVRPPDYDMERDPAKMNLSEVSFILCTSDLPFSKYEFKSAMCFVCRFEDVMCHLLSKSLRRDLHMELPENVAGETGGFRGGTLMRPTFTMSREAVSYIKPSVLTAWIFSNRVGPNETPLYKWLLKSKYTVWRAIRRCYALSSYLWDIGMHLRERLIFKQQGIKPPEKVDTREKTSFRLAMEMGKPPPGGGEDGTNIYWKLSKVDNPIDFLTKLHLPKDIGSGIIIDLLRNVDVEEEEIIKACAMLKHEIMEHFGEELESSQHFRGIFIFPTVNDTDNTPVVRICFALKRAISIDNFMKMIGIPYTIDDIVNHFYGEISLNTHILDIIDSCNSSFDTYMYATGNVFIEYYSEMVVTLVEAVRVAFAAGPSFETVFNARSAKGKDPDPWAHLRPEFPKITKLCDEILLNLRRTKSCSWSLSYSKASEFVERVASLNPWMFTKAGAIPPAHFAACKKLSKQIKVLHGRMKEFLVGKQDAREADRARKASLSEKSRKAEAFQKTKADMLNRLARIGVEASDKDVFDDVTKTPEQYAEDVKEIQMENDIRAYETLERFKALTRGFHSCEILLGKSRLSVSCAGMDVFDLLPNPPSISQVKVECAERERISVRQAELDLSEFTVSSEEIAL